MGEWLPWLDVHASAQPWVDAAHQAHDSSYDVLRNPTCCDRYFVTSTLVRPTCPMPSHLRMYSYYKN
ncbi:MAG: hypothetical protein IKM35_04805 [Bacteroidaceae bacterium]|nr:hypothetical protein [Bacteroidaceae bacterium]